MEETLLSHYRKDSVGNYLLELKIEDLDELYNPYDPLPFKLRDLNPKVVDIIEEQIRAFKEKIPVKMVIYLPKKIKKNIKQEDIVYAIKHHFEYKYLDSNEHLRNRLNKGKNTFFMAGIIFILFFSLSKLINKLFSDNMIFTILSEGLFVVSWVSLWHPLEILLYEWIPLFEEKKRINRIRNMQIEINFI